MHFLHFFAAVNSCFFLEQISVEGTPSGERSYFWMSLFITLILFEVVEFI